MEDNYPQEPDRLNRYSGAVNRPITWSSWLAVACLILGAIALLTNFAGAALEELADKNTDRLIAELYKPWKDRIESGHQLLQAFNSDLVQGKMSGEQFASAVRLRVRPEFERALHVAEQFQTRTHDDTRFRGQFQLDSRRAIRYIDELLDGLDKNDRESVIRANTSYAEYAKAAPAKYQTLLSAGGVNRTVR